MLCDPRICLTESEVLRIDNGNNKELRVCGIGTLVYLSAH